MIKKLTRREIKDFCFVKNQTYAALSPATGFWSLVEERRSKYEQQIEYAM